MNSLDIGEVWHEAMAYGSAMRILICPDSFGGTLSAFEASQAIASGWSSAIAAAELQLMPLSDGGPGFLTTLATALGGEFHSAQVTNAFGSAIEVEWLQIDSTAYIEVAAICGIQDSPRTPMAALAASSLGVGELINNILQIPEIDEINLGLGGTSITDGGAGLLAGLGAKADVSLGDGGGNLTGISYIDLENLPRRLTAVRLNFWTDVDVPLLGKRGAALGFAAQKGAGPAEQELLESNLTIFADLIGKTLDGKNPAIALGAGAAGGIGFALHRLGGNREPGIRKVLEVVQFEKAAAWANLIITGEGKLDWQSEVGKVITGVCSQALLAARPVLALVGQNDLSTRELQNLGVHGVYSMSDLFGIEQSMTAPAETLSKVAKRAAQTWGRN